MDLTYFTAKLCIQKTSPDEVRGSAQLNCRLVSTVVKAIIACTKYNWLAVAWCNQRNHRFVPAVLSGFAVAWNTISHVFAFSSGWNVFPCVRTKSVSKWNPVCYRDLI